MAFHEKGQMTRVKYWNTPHLTHLLLSKKFLCLDTKISLFSHLNTQSEDDSNEKENRKISDIRF